MLPINISLFTGSSAAYSNRGHNLKNNHKIKLIAASLALTTSFSAVGGLGGLNVQSNLGEPFSGTVTVTGEEARILLNGGHASLSDGNLRASVRKSGNNAVINIRSGAPVNNPVLVFQVGVGSQSRQYTAIIDPADYPAESSGSTGVQPENSVQTAQTQTDETAARAEISTSAATKAKLKAQKTQEQTRKEQQKAAAAERGKLREQAVAERKSEPPRGNYKVTRGETLTSIASQIRPAGLSIRDTIAAIMTANPEIFPTRNANQILAGRVLNIPSPEELKRLAKQPTPTLKEQAGQASQPTEASAPIETAAASAPVSLPSTDSTTATASAPQASEPAIATIDSVVSEPSTSAESTTSASMAATAQPTEPASEENSSLWRWLLFSGLGAIALWLLLKLISKKKATAGGITESGNDSIVTDSHTDTDGEYKAPDPAPETENRTEQPKTYPNDEAKSSVETIPAATTTAAATQSKAEDDSLDMEDDFDDIFFSETETAPVEKTEGNFNLDLGSIDREQAGIVSGALTQDEETQKREYADWDNIESTESVYEPETESEYQHVAVEFNAGEDVTENQKATTATEHESIDSVIETVETTVLDTPLQVSDDIVTDQTADNKEQRLAPIETITVPELEVETAGIDALPRADKTDTPILEAQLETTTEQLSSSVEVAENNQPETIHASGSAFSPTKAEQPESYTRESAWAAVSLQENGFTYQDEEDFDNTVNLSTDDEETIEWESISVEDSSRSDDVFISESVGMTAPLEAKYELAQMYVEIGDPEAAKETLQELLEESSGIILEKAKTMLAELDK
ncbi:fimV N-terminal domain [Neisseria musculi]|uniref:FimV N-terminal domain n=1 Tax=Neisseria musculi TaxID=1815583 RepID=A0A7H1MBV6_9NEIS|nr:fimV N-terminal domain [Neisseria musculi]